MAYGQKSIIGSSEFRRNYTEIKSLTKILDQNALEYLAFGKDFILDRIGDARNLNENLKTRIRVLRGLLLDDEAEGGAVMGFGGFDEEAFLATTKLESMV